MEIIKNEQYSSCDDFMDLLKQQFVDLSRCYSRCQGPHEFICLYTDTHSKQKRCISIEEYERIVTC